MEGTSQCSEVQALCNADATKEPWTIRFPSEYQDLPAFVTCMVFLSLVRHQLGASASISGEQTSHTYSHQLLESQELLHNGPAAARKYKYHKFGMNRDNKEDLIWNVNSQNQIGYWVVNILTGIPQAIPLIGLPLVALFLKTLYKGRYIERKIIGQHIISRLQFSSQ